MSIKIIDTLDPLGRFAAVKAKDVEVEAEGKRLDEVIAELEAGSGTGGTKNYNDLENQPKVNGVTLVGNKSTADLGINIPTKTSQLQNDSNFLTEHQSLEAYAKKSEVPNVPQWAMAPSKPGYEKSEIGLGYVDNTSDEDKPISNATQAVIDEMKSNISTGTAATENNAVAIAVERARIDSLIGEVPSGSQDEIADARIMANGKTASNLGNAVRNQFSELSEIASASGICKTIDFSTQTEGYVRPTGVIWTDAFNHVVIDVKKGDTVILNACGYSNNVAMIATYNPKYNGNTEKHTPNVVCTDNLYKKYTYKFTKDCKCILSYSGAKDHDGYVVSEPLNFDIDRIVKSSSVNVITDSKPAPYNNLDTLPVNEIVLYSNIEGIELPTTGIQHFAIVTMSYNGDSKTDAAQIMFASNSHVYARMNMGGKGYIPWIDLNEDTAKFMSSSNVNIFTSEKTAPYDNLDTLPSNKFVVYSDVAGLELPDDKITWCSVFTMAPRTTSMLGAVQFMFTDNNRFYYRQYFHSIGGYKPWINLTQNDAVMASGNVNITTSEKTAPYDNLDTLPANKFVIYSDVAGLELPDEEISWCSVFTMAPRTSSMLGTVQLMFTDKNQLFFRQYFYRVGYKSWINLTQNAEASLYHPCLSMFRKFGVIGDSYASGEICYDGNYIDYYDLSWGQILARKLGTECLNLSEGGLTTRSWLTSSYGLSLLNSSEKQNIYYLVLGINDYYKLGLSYLGTINDIKSDSSQNADTFFGNYGRIISAVKAKAPNAKIVMFTLAGTTDLIKAFNNAIVEIANHFNIPYIVPNDHTLFKSSFYSSGMANGHPLAVLYSAMANAYEDLLEGCLVSSFNYFKDFTGTV